MIDTENRGKHSGLPDIDRRLAVVPAIALIVCLMPETALAFTTAPPGATVATVLCTVAGWLQGPVGKAVAMLGVVALGLMAMFGRIQISSVLITLAGIAMIFGAQAVLELVGLSGSCGGGTSAASILSDPLIHVLGCTAKIFNGPLAKALASLAIIALGLFAMNGRISYHQAMVTGVGIAVIFGGGAIVGSLGIPVAPTSSNTPPGNIPLLTTCNSGLATDLDKIFCNLAEWFIGPIGKGLAILVVVTLGIMALFGKVTYEKALLVGVGIAAVMGSSTIIKALNNNVAANCIPGPLTGGG